MATSPIYNWPEPDNTDLVKNGALAIRTLGNAIDTTMATMTPKSIVDAKGDLIAASAADTPARLAVGNNGETLVADSSTATGLRYSQLGVGNPVINSGIEIWQRGTADITLTAASATFFADRFFGARATGTSGAKIKYLSASGIAGLPNAFTVQRDAGNTSTSDLYVVHNLETKDSLRYAGQTVTLSFYAKAGANYSAASNNVNVRLTSGTGTDQGGYPTTWTGSSSLISTNQALTTSFVRYSFTGTVASNATQLGILLAISPTGTAGADDSASFTGFQIDLGSVALPYRRAGGTIQGELAACQRYYFRGDQRWQGFNGSITTAQRVSVSLPVEQRTNTQTITIISTTLSGFSGVTAEAYAPETIILLPAPSVLGDNKFWIVAYDSSAEL